ncbi:protein disulfide isomerase [Plasmodium vivax India VII]|uniref:Protein disulfide isomerase, putative n=5 Tax=Plasmodium vivax TaxID=5855 RepID=A5K6Q8_PLAVS|nr:protein disulfide isomerase, putative [Plasmodium vivax]KMZ81258.1 protein disulfide isomerase [Plasmodium vivax India VII]KMZ87404.1 protein disulfide isomerase [Plasmodium vivax Brazil I]KMZ93998.1 protein disulfide isomerase [Plasmodium vivax Mauritania I]KNA00394.1 protein disulfide isomerase [Plasmodium vivax North Korean]EDL44999.1 protein disulfide isomerase, putative [Plasmodium vivax]|eukprot:XP_001614726.1 protein disulfide isomerase [Plasmodium vivax Sal-1]
MAEKATRRALHVVPRWALPLLLFLFCGYYVSGAVWEGVTDEEAKNVKHLTHEVELQIYSQHTLNCIALFCNNKEVACKDVYVEFVKAANELASDEIAFVYVDTIALKKTADNFDIQKIPKILTFKDFDPEKGYTFGKKYTKENIVEWFKLLPIPSIEVMEKDHVGKYVEMQKKKGYASIIAFCVKNSDHVHKFFHFGETHSLANLAVGMVYTDQESEVKIEISNGPGATIPSEQIKYNDVYKPQNNVWVSSDILKFASEYMAQFPVVLNYRRTLHKPQRGEIYVYLYGHYGHYSDALYAELAPVMRAHHPQSDEVVDLLGSEQGGNFILVADYREATVDVLFGLLRPKKYIKQLQSEGINAEQLSQAISQFHQKELPQIKKSEKEVKRREQERYQMICANNFESFVLDPKKIVLMFYHVEGCKECKPLFSFWSRVSNFFHLENKYKDVLVATMDAKLNDMADESVDFYPSVAIYPTGSDKLKRKKFLLFPLKLETLIDLVDELMEDVQEDL